ncbi:4-formylbenzenesulfonate dehydrogenase TsaC1/TsaC2 [Pseudovibrio axinellae]|uniref:4-formylbenzenesulfonate dehydrogenase TsaC1/TsaC2 n=1 Tax=Pseudovibrio axinellae TaxID=989403 RepID=A0A165U292_9HYPH|nr:SDR family oxidoreductase [Pseudovibrio axinellae]KZL09479.1 4-formylbenzenesulfonate dehydrogenase TsaC1/TsaC2 [Pseudovibrio axinellae]SEQ63578.1 3-oxoacyl-[acyl-carrier protein] reductase [Pseudovibrio axinellae]
MSGRLEGKTAIITGGAAGFGEGIARTYAQEGASVIIADMNGIAGKELAAKLGDRVFSVETDVTVRSDVKAMVAFAIEETGQLDIIVNNAGYTHRNCPLTQVDENNFDRILEVNAKAIYLTTLEVLPEMEKQGGGVIINTASTAGIRPRPGLTWYNASKGWVITATKSMAVELAPKNIRVNALCPVAGETDMLELFMGADTTENRQQFLNSIPLGRFSKPEDIANAALWLASDESQFITGVALEVDGGRTI